MPSSNVERPEKSFLINHAAFRKSSEQGALHRPTVTLNGAPSASAVQGTWLAPQVMVRATTSGRPGRQGTLHSVQEIPGASALQDARNEC